MDNGMIRREMDAFQASVMKLSKEIGRASALWNDPKYSELSSSVSIIANISKNVIIAGDKCCSSIENVEKIAAEKY